MSDRRCNYCSYMDLKKKRPKGTRVHVVPSHRVLSDGTEFGGVDVFFVPEGAELDTSVDREGNHGKQFAVWFMELPDHCVC